MSQAIQGATFHVEHVVPRSRGGSDEESNLALACPSCNLHKAERTHGEDPDSLRMVALFDPRVDQWADHFEIRGSRIEGLTPTGRATAESLQFNGERRLRIRDIERLLGLDSRPD